MEYQPLSREEIINVIEGKGAAKRVPVILQFWTHPEEFDDRIQEAEKIMADYPQDVQPILMEMPRVFTYPEDDKSYRFAHYDDPYPANTPIDSKVVIRDWDEEMEDFLANFPSPEYHGLLPQNPEEDGRYRLGYWWNGLFERLWQMRGMTEALMDFYLNPERIREIFRAFTDFYLRAMERAKIEVGVDGFFMSDDLGTQTNTFFSREIFAEFFLPYYKEIFDKAHELGCHFWLHTCGNVFSFIEDFIAIGLDVIHPIQKYTMEEKEVSEAFGDKICIWAGFDVQRTIPWGSPDEVEQEVQFMLDAYYREEGYLMLTAGNGINGDCSIESLKRLYDSCYRLGSKIGKE